MDDLELLIAQITAALSASLTNRIDKWRRLRDTMQAASAAYDADQSDDNRDAFEAAEADLKDYTADLKPQLEKVIQKQQTPPAPPANEPPVPPANEPPVPPANEPPVNEPVKKKKGPWATIFTIAAVGLAAAVGIQYSRR